MRIDYHMSLAQIPNMISHIGSIETRTLKLQLGICRKQIDRLELFTKASKGNASIAFSNIILEVFYIALGNHYLVSKNCVAKLKFQDLMELLKATFILMFSGPLC